MIEKKLLNSGYFPKELPPPFQTKVFASNIDDIKKDWKKKFDSLAKPNKLKYKESKWSNFSIPKVGLSRRTLNIPNPLHHSPLCEAINKNWLEIEKIFVKSNISASFPIVDSSDVRALKTNLSFSEFKSLRSNSSFDKFYEVKTDISRFYNTIYTHVIPWILHTKSVAKIKRDDFSLLGNLLDKKLRVGNHGQTLGIPVGPDSSLVIAEIIMCSLDELFQNKFKTVKAFRYIDDFYIYCDDYAEAEKAFKYFQGILTEFQLDINEEKTEISKTPFLFDKKWSIELGMFSFRNSQKSQLTDIERFVNLSLIHSFDNPKDSVLLFTMQVLKFLRLYDDNWDTYESQVLKIAMAEPRTLPILAEILSSYDSKVDKSKVKSTLEKIIKIHVIKGHNYEVSWALWICRELKIKLPNNIADLIFQSNDVASILIGLDLRKRNLINLSVDTSNLEIELTEESLMAENWLLTYESIYKGWLTPPLNPINKNEYFKILKDKKVYFYDENAQTEKFVVKSPIISDKDSVKLVKPEIAKVIFSGGGGGGGPY